MVSKNWIILQQWGMWLPPMPAVLTFSRAVHSLRFQEEVGVSVSSWIIELYQDRSLFRADKEGWKNFCQSCFSKLRENPLWQKKLVEKFLKKTPNFLTFCEDLYENDLSSKSDKELFKLYKEYINLYGDLYIDGEIFAFGSRDGLTDYLKEYLHGKLRDVSTDELLRVFDILITPEEKSFILEEKEALLRIAKEDPIDLDKKLEEHTKKYQWIPYNYGSFLFDKDYFKKELNRLKRENLVESELENIKNTYKNLAQKQQQLIKDLGIDKSHQELFEALRLNSFIIDYKKRVFTISHFQINFSLIKEIAERLRINQKFVHCLFVEELEEVLVNKKELDLKELEDRVKGLVFFIDHEKFEFAVGSKVDDFHQKYEVIEKKVDRLREFKGQVASLGSLEGRVKVITGPKDFHKMKPGDIIVSHMTTPEYVPILKFASGIITDEGGITCHAAIVSRELKIPCVIGTKIATQVLHDNNLVELRASEGLVKVLYTSSPNF
jgi:phosphohistidine swiveling domain-containing protein